MGANKLLKEQMAKHKADMKARYIAGEAVLAIARDYGVSDRAIYYHLGELSPEEQALHAKNMKLRRMAGKQAKKKESVPPVTTEETTPINRKEEQEDAEESTAKKTGSVMADFIE